MVLFTYKNDTGKVVQAYMKLTPEQKKAAVEGFQKHDFTKNISLVLPDLIEEDETDEQEEQEVQEYQLLKTVSPLAELVKGYMKDDLPELGLKRPAGNFTGDHPINFLMDVDAKYIAQKAEAVLADKDRATAAVDYYFDMFGPLLETEIANYCEAKGKSPDDLTEEELNIILARMTDVVDQELLSVVMQGQQFPEIGGIAHKMPTHEDFGKLKSDDAKNFYNKWTRCKTAVGAMLTLDDEKNPVDVPTQEMGPEEHAIIKAFIETLDDVDTTIFRMREDGRTHAEIAAKLGYKNHSAVTKRLTKMRERWDEFIGNQKP